VEERRFSAALAARISLGFGPCDRKREAAEVTASRFVLGKEICHSERSVASLYPEAAQLHGFFASLRMTKEHSARVTKGK
jgi:hypothetical protein